MRCLFGARYLVCLTRAMLTMDDATIELAQVDDDMPGCNNSPRGYRGRHCSGIEVVFVRGISTPLPNRAKRH